MKKIISVVLAVLIMILSCGSIAFASSADETILSVLTPSIDDVFAFAKTLFTKYTDSASKKIVAARSFYFYIIINDDYSSNIDIFDDTGHKFTNEILDFYFEQYASTKKSIFGSSNDIFNSKGDIFLQAAGFVNTPWSLSLCSFGIVLENGSGAWGEYDKVNFKQYYQTMLARYLLENGETATDPAPGKNGLEIAPAYVTSDELIEGIEKDNLMFFPKNYDAKISYRTDEYFQKRQANNPSSREYYSPFIVNNSLFVGTNNAQKTYFVYFYELDGKKYYSENVFCLYFDVTEVFDDNGDFVRYNKTLNLKLWSGIDGTEDEALVFYQGTVDISDYKYIALDTAGSTSSYFYLDCFKSLTNYLTKNSSGYKCLSKQGYDSTYTKLYSSDLIYKGGFYTIVNGYSDHKFIGSYDYHTTEYSERCHNNCDVGILVSDNPIEYTFRSIDTSKIGRGQIVTINGGDTIYNYTITNPETGDSSKFGDYITNNYTYITNNNGGSSSSGGSDGTVGGKVEVGGKIDVGGSVGVDVNVNVNGVGGTSSSLNPSDFTSGDTVDTKKYFDSALEMSENTQNFLGDFFSFLPPDILVLILFGLTMAIVCRVGGR